MRIIRFLHVLYETQKLKFLGCLNWLAQLHGSPAATGCKGVERCSVCVNVLKIPAKLVMVMAWIYQSQITACDFITVLFQVRCHENMKNTNSRVMAIILFALGVAHDNSPS